MLKPGHSLPVLILLNGQVRHPRRCGCTMPVLFTWGEPDDVTGIHRFHCPTFTLDPATAIENDEHLAKRVSVPGSACSGLERHPRDMDTGRWRSIKDRINANITGKRFSRTFA